MSILDELKRAHPESVLQRMSQYAFKTEEHIGTITNCSELSAEQKQDIREYIENMEAFFKYVSPLIEPIAYCTIENVKLIRKDYFDRFKELISILNQQTEREIELLRNQLRDSATFIAERERVLDELSKMENIFNHPYQ